MSRHKKCKSIFLLNIYQIPSTLQSIFFKAAHCKEKLFPVLCQWCTTSTRVFVSVGSIHHTPRLGLSPFSFHPGLSSFLSYLELFPVMHCRHCASGTGYNFSQAFILMQVAIYMHYISLQDNYIIFFCMMIKYLRMDSPFHSISYFNPPFFPSRGHPFHNLNFKHMVALILNYIVKNALH